MVHAGEQTALLINWLQNIACNSSRASDNYSAILLLHLSSIHYSAICFPHTLISVLPPIPLAHPNSHSDSTTAQKT